MTHPVFPDFKPLTLDDRAAVHERLWAYQPTTSELTFVNLYLWRNYYDFQWSVHEDWLLIRASHEDEHFILPPLGPASRRDVTAHVLAWLRDSEGVAEPFVARADQRLVDELGEDARFVVEPTPDHFDYVYTSEALGELSGRQYSKKRNHINQFERAHDYEYAPLSPELVEGCLALAEVWCEQRMCDEDISLTHEFQGIQDVLDNFAEMQMEGGVLLIEGKVQAFALGELLNEDMAVVHIEKANPNFSHIYPVMTKQFSAQRWLGNVTYINREQDLGIPGLRRAKESYYPDHLEKKYRVRLQ